MFIGFCHCQRCCNGYTDLLIECRAFSWPPSHHNIHTNMPVDSSVLLFLWVDSQGWDLWIESHMYLCIIHLIYTHLLIHINNACTICIEIDINLHFHQQYLSVFFFFFFFFLNLHWQIKHIPGLSPLVQSIRVMIKKTYNYFIRYSEWVCDTQFTDEGRWRPLHKFARLATKPPQII